MTKIQLDPYAIRTPRKTELDRTQELMMMRNHQRELQRAQSVQRRIDNKRSTT